MKKIDIEINDYEWHLLYMVLTDPPEWLTDDNGARTAAKNLADKILDSTLKNKEQ